MDLKNISISIIGFGWLGSSLAESLTAAGHKVIATTTTLSKKEQSSSQLQIEIFNILTQTPTQKITSSDVLIYLIPPLGLGEIEHFFKNIDLNQKIIFISSTSVYGKSLGAVNELTSLLPTSQNGILLQLSENYLRSRFKNLTILRPGGLYGKERHPIHSLQGKTNLTTGQEYLHLVHLDNVISAILKIIENNFWSENFNLVNDLRILKKDYYIEEAKKRGLIPPEYIDTPIENQTNISNEKSKKILSLHYFS